MATAGLLALIDDVASIADGVAQVAGAAAKKTTAIVTDDMAVTAEQAVGIRREREIPVIVAVARGSLINKCVYLAPGALVMSAVAPWALTPVLMVGGAYLCFEGVAKVLPGDQPHADDEPLVETDPDAYEAGRIRSAIRTDLVLSAEIVAISLGEVASAPFLTQVLALYVISVVMTVGVYGVVAGLVKIDDLGEALVRAGGARVPLGRAIVRAAPRILHAIATIGTAAMLLVGGQILLHGIPPLAHAVEQLVVGRPALVRAAVGMLADLGVGVVSGGILVAAASTGIPARMLGFVRRADRASGRTPRTR